MITAHELRTKYIQFFTEKGHTQIPSQSLIPEHDPTALFINSGMHPLIPYFSGQPHPQGTRLVNAQRCIRTTDIDEVGDTTHNTFFEMLGNWSLGDYGKEEAIQWSFEFLTSKQWLNIPIQKLTVTIFEGDDLVPRDTEAAEIWEKLGIPKDHIFYLGREDNWWQVGEFGLCGPDTEIFFDRGEGEIKPDETPGQGDRFVEIWNNVFMEYEHKEDGTYHELTQKNIDTGMGLERTVAILNNQESNFDTDLFTPALEAIQQAAQQPNETSLRIIADHARATVFLLADGVTPSNVDQGYILRRLMRRAIRHAQKIQIPQETNILKKLAKIYIKQYKEHYPHLEKQQKTIIKEMIREEQKFEKTLEKGLREFHKLDNISGKEAFQLFSTYGFPLELTQELAKEEGKTVDTKEFEKEFEQHQEVSRTTSKEKFKGGLADYSEKTTQYHTATHLLHYALREVLGEHVVQKGSNITEKRLRFDFSHPEKLTDEEKQQVTDRVNELIQQQLPVTKKEVSLEEAKQEGALGVFDDKYQDTVSVYAVGDTSREICGGPHVENTSELGTFRIKKEQSSSAGIRRIKGVLE